MLHSNFDFSSIYTVTKIPSLFLSCSDCAPAFVAPQGRSEETARKLWDASCELLGIEWD